MEIVRSCQFNENVIHHQLYEVKYTEILMDHIEARSGQIKLGVC